MTQVELVRNTIWAIMTDAYIKNLKSLKKSYCDTLKDEKLVGGIQKKRLANRVKRIDSDNFYGKLLSLLNILVHFHQKEYCPLTNGLLFSSIFSFDDSKYSIKEFLKKESNVELHRKCANILSELSCQPKRNYIQVVTICQPVFDKYKLYCKFRNGCIDSWVDKLPFTLKPKCRYRDRKNFREGWQEILGYLIDNLDTR